MLSSSAKRTAQVGAIIQFGVQPPNSDTALIVADSRVEAEHALESVADGRVVQRTITYGVWLAENDFEGMESPAERQLGGWSVGAVARSRV